MFRGSFRGEKEEKERGKKIEKGQVDKALDRRINFGLN